MQMNIRFLKHWLRGFKESVDGAPTQEQWARLVKRIEGMKDLDTPLGDTAPLEMVRYSDNLTYELGRIDGFKDPQQIRDYDESRLTLD